MGREGGGREEEKKWNYKFVTRHLFSEYDS